MRTVGVGAYRQGGGEEGVGEHLDGEDFTAGLVAMSFHVVASRSSPMAVRKQSVKKEPKSSCHGFGASEKEGRLHLYRPREALIIYTLPCCAAPTRNAGRACISEPHE